jgi:hypothetical protein
LYANFADLLQGENKALQDAEKQSREAWETKYQDMFWQLQDFQEQKDHPQAQVVNMEVEELYDALPFTYLLPLTYLLQFQTTLQIATRPV